MTSPKTTATTLQAAAVQAAKKRYADRLAAIEQMAKQLALLDAFMPAIEAAGIVLCADEIKTWVGPCLWVREPIFDRTRNARLAEVLKAQGMKEQTRVELILGEHSLVLVKGRLSVSLTVRGGSQAAVAATQQETRPCK